MAVAITPPVTRWADAPGGMPWIEAPREVIEHYNMGNMDGFKAVGFFVINGCRVYEEGKREEYVAKEELSVTERDFGTK